MTDPLEDPCISKPEQPTGETLGARHRVWSSFWRRGALHSLQGSFEHNYEGEIRTFWDDVFSGAASGHRILDIGTGNGPLPAMLCERDPSETPTVDAIDIASVSPAWLSSASGACRRAINFHSNVSVEQLPFADNAYDMVVSQYGFEYAAPNASVREISRVLKASGTLAFVVHHARSRVADIALAEVESTRWLQSESVLFDATAAVVPYMALASRGRAAGLITDPGAGACRIAFNEAMQTLKSRMDETSFPDLLAECQGFVGTLVEGVLRGQYSAANALARLAEFRSELEDARFRHAELLACALDESGVADLSAMLVSEGFKPLQSEPLRQDSHLLGWSLRTSRGR